MKIGSLRWWAVLVPTAAIILLDYARHEFVSGFVHPWRDEAALLVGVLLITFATVQLLFERIDRSQRREREAEALRQIGIEITSTLQLDAILASVLARGRELLGVECAGMTLAGSPHRELTMLTRGAPHPRSTRPSAGACFPWEAMETGELRESDRVSPSAAEGACVYCRRCLAIPLRMGDEVLGAFCVGSSRSRPYSSAERKLAAQMANLASVAIANALLHERAQNLATLEERDRIAREMHDSLAQVLGYLSMKAATARGQLGRGNLAPLDGELAEMGQVADEAYLDVREAILGLRLSTRASGGFTAALGEYLRKFSRQSGVAARLEMQEGESFAMPPRIEIQLVRVIQEALTNIRKHAHATNACVQLKRRDGQVCVKVGDDGRGFDPVGVDAQPTGGFGITTMRERLAGIGGDLAVESRLGRGTTVVARVPLGIKDGDSDVES